MTMTFEGLAERALRLALGLTGALVLLFSTPARADNVADEAELHFQRGAESYRQGNYTDALEHFLASNRLSPNRNVQYNIARAFEQLDKFPEAYRYYVGALRGENDPATKKSVEEAIARVAPNVAAVEVVSEPPGANVYLNRRDLGSVGTTPARLGLPTGEYKILVELDGYEPAETTALKVAKGSQTPVSLKLKRIVGRVEVGGTPGLAVHPDDEVSPAVCETPCSFELPPGQHVLYFTSKEAVTIAPRTVAVVANKSVQVKANVVQLTGSLVVSAEESNALVEVDGKPLGFTPAVMSNIPIGKRKVRVSLRGYRTYETEVNIEYQKQSDLRDVRLVPLREVAAASRRTEQIEDAPASVSIITSQELQAFAYPTILEALRGVRGMAITYDSIYGNAGVRGLGQPNDYNNRLLVLTDGAILNENILYQPFIHYDGRTDLGDVDRIEVVRGPGSVLYGTGAVSGVVNLVLKGREEPDGVEVGVSSYDDSVARARGAFKTTFAKDAGMWGSVSAARSGGRDTKLRFDADGDGIEDANPIQGFDKFRSYSTVGKMWWKDVTAQWFGTLRKIEIPTGSFGTIVNRLENTYTDGRALGEIRYEPRISKKFQLLTRGYLNYCYFDLDYLFEVETDDGMGNLSTWEQPYYETYNGTWAGAEARGVWDPDEDLTVSVGSEIAHHFQVDMATGQTELDGTETDILRVDAPYTVFAGYGLAEWRAQPWLTLSAGARVDRWNLSQDQLSAESNMPVADDFTSVSPRLAAIFKHKKSDIVKVMGGRAFRAPSTYEYFYTDDGITQVTSDCCGSSLEPETVWSGEVEYTHKFDQDWSALASVHGLAADNVVETVLVPDDVLMANGWEEGVTYYANSATRQFTYGGDLEVRRDWRNGWMANVQYGLLNARYQDAGGGDPRLANAPRHFFSFRGVVPIVPNLVSGGVRTTVEGPRRIDTEATDKTDPAVITDLVLSGNVSRYNLRYAAGVYNLFNWQYELPAAPYASRLMPQSPRSFIFSLSLAR